MAYPTTSRESKPVDDANDEPRSEPSAENAWQNGFLVRTRTSADEASTISLGGQGEGDRGMSHQPFAAWCRSMRSKADRASCTVYSWSGSRQ